MHPRTHQTGHNLVVTAAWVLVQGWGQLINLGVLMLGLLAFNSKGSGPYSHGAAGATYRFSFGCIAVLTAWMVYYRTWRLKPAKPVAKSEGLTPSATIDKVHHFQTQSFLCSAQSVTTGDLRSVAAAVMTESLTEG